MGWDDWSRGNPIDLARYVTPLAKRWLPLEVNAYDVERGPDGRRRLAQAIYSALLNRKVQYAPPESNASEQLQTIRSPAEVLGLYGQGTCLDLAVVFCGVCLGYNLLPVLVVTEGHAFAAVSLTRSLRGHTDYGPDRELFRTRFPLVDARPLRELIDDGVLLAVECTGFAHTDTFGHGDGGAWPEAQNRVGGVLSFDHAVESGRAQLDCPGRPFQFALDIAVAHRIKELHPYKPPRGMKAPNRFNDVQPVIASVPKLKPKIASSRFPRHSPKKFFGREKWLDALDTVWAQPLINVYTLVAWGGAGKTSLVAHWVNTRLAAKGWPDVERYLDWSFYTQGTGESRQTSSLLFIQHALKFFDDPEPTKGTSLERGERLAGLIRRQRTLLVLDGIESLQYPPNDPQAGLLKDLALEALLQGLAAHNPGLCIVTTREQLKNIENQATTEAQKLDKLEKEATIDLFRHLKIIGTEEEMEEAWKAADGHALTLQLLGQFIAHAYEDKDIRHYKEVKFEEADRERQGRSASKVMIAYERWLQSAGLERQRELAILRLTGLFDRPIPRDCLDVLRDWKKPLWIQRFIKRRPRQIWHTFGPLASVSNKEINIALNRLGEVDLLTVTRHAIDAHPLIREYFAKQLRDTQPEAFKAAHSRLFDHLCLSTPPHPDTLEGLQPLYQAVTHGCLAGRHKEAFDKVFIDRISRGTDGGANYSAKTFGAIGDDLAALAAFFEEPWSRVSPALDEVSQAWRLAQVGQILHALGRLTEALHPTQTALQIHMQREDKRSTAIIAVNLSELKMTMGRLEEAVSHARQANSLADQVGEAYWQMVTRSTLANALVLCGQETDVNKLFSEGEQFQKEWTQKKPPQMKEPQKSGLLNLRWGFQYCDWQLASVERAVWQAVLRGLDGTPVQSDESARICDQVESRAKTTLSLVEPTNWLLDIALDHLTLARIGLFRAILKNPRLQPALSLPRIDEAVNGLRDSRQEYELPKGLLTAALYHFLRGELEAARVSLNKAEQIASRGPMPLYLADIHLHRARLFCDRAELIEATKLIRVNRYGRRYGELADTESAAANWPPL